MLSVLKSARAVIAFTFLFFAARLWLSAAHYQGSESDGEASLAGVPVIGLFLGGLSLITGAIVLYSTRLAHFFAHPLHRWIDSLYLPGGYAKRPPLNYDLPLYYERHFRGEEALDAYEELLRFYPKEARAHAGKIRVLSKQLDDKEGSAAWHARAKRVCDPEALAAEVAKSAAQLYAEKMQCCLAPAPHRPAFAYARPLDAKEG